MKRGTLLIAAALLLSACVAVTVERRRPRRGPIKEVGFIELGGGHVRYSAEGWAWIVASRRKTALKLMSRNCGADLEPVVTDEYSRTDADAPYNGVDIDSSMSIGDEHYKIERYIHLAYECRPRGAAALAASTSTASGATLVIPAVAASTSSVVAVSTAAAAVVAPSTAAVSAPSPSSATLASPEPPK